MCSTHGGLVLVGMPNGPSKMTTCEKPYNSVNANNPSICTATVWPPVCGAAHWHLSFLHSCTIQRLDIVVLPECQLLSFLSHTTVYTHTHVWEVASGKHGLVLEPRALLVRRERPCVVDAAGALVHLGAALGRTELLAGVRGVGVCESAHVALGGAGAEHSLGGGRDGGWRVDQYSEQWWLMGNVPAATTAMVARVTARNFIVPEKEEFEVCFGTGGSDVLSTTRE